MKKLATLCYIARPPVGRQVRYQSSRTATKSKLVKNKVHTHFVALPLHHGTLKENLTNLRTLLDAKGRQAGFPKGGFARRLGQTLMLRVGGVNIKGYKTFPTAADPSSTPSFELDEVHQVLKSAKESIRALLKGEPKVVLHWGIMRALNAAVEDQDTTDLNGMNRLVLYPALGTSYSLVEAIHTLLHQKMTAAGMTTYSPRMYRPRLTLANTTMSSRPTTFNAKSLFTIPGFDQYRKYTLPSDDQRLLRGIQVDLGFCTVKSAVLEPCAMLPPHHIDEGNPTFDASIDFS